MALIKWDPKYSVNIAEIDKQHQKIMDLINQLHDAMLVGKSKDVVGKVLGELVQYTVHHFGTEERLFAKHGYPDRVTHKVEHDALTKRAGELKAQFDGGKAPVTIEVLKFLRDWLTHHILGSDHKYVAFLNAAGVR